MNLLFFLTPKQDVLFIYEDFTLRQTLEKWSNQRFATIPVLKRNGEYLGTMTEGDILWGIKSIHGLDIDASEDIPIASFPRRRDYKAVPVTTDMHALLNAAVDQNFVPVVDDRNVFIGIVRRTAILQQVVKDYESPKGNVFPETAKKAKPARRRHLCKNIRLFAPHFSCVLFHSDHRGAHCMPVNLAAYQCQRKDVTYFNKPYTQQTAAGERCSPLPRHLYF